MKKKDKDRRTHDILLTHQLFGTPLSKAVALSNLKEATKKLERRKKRRRA